MSEGPLLRLQGRTLAGHCGHGPLSFLKERGALPDVDGVWSLVLSPAFAVTVGSTANPSACPRGGLWCDGTNAISGW